MPTVIHSGYLTKRGHRFPTWKRRYFEICDDGLLSYYTAQGGTLKGSFQFNIWTVIAPDSFFDEKTYGFTLRGNMTSLYIKVGTQEEKERWLLELEHLLQCVKRGETVMLMTTEGDADKKSKIECSNRSISDVDIDNSAMEMSYVVRRSESLEGAQHPRSF